MGQNINLPIWAKLHVSAAQLYSAERKWVYWFPES